jgi:DNA (cytosine-5)-methyltransferase 1
MTATVTDLFCGAGGSSLGAEAAGVEVVMAANHWRTAIEVHQAHFPSARHDCTDISQADPRRYPRTDILLASPECTNHSQARGVSRRRQDPTLWDAPDPAAERSRATMWDVVRFAEQMAYEAIVVENVVEATRWVGWRAWCIAMEDLGYQRRVLSHNSMHHRVPQSRDRIYVVFTRRGLAVDLEMEHSAYCPRCDTLRAVRQAWKNDRTVGRYRQQWIWACTTCGTTCEPGVRPAADIIDWRLPCPRIGDRQRPLAAATRARILAGLRRYGWIPVITAGAGHTHETAPGSRAHPVTTSPLPVQGTTAQHALATPPGFLLQTAHGARIHPLDEPHPTVCASDDRLAFVVPLPSGRNRSHTADEPMATVLANGNYGGLVVPLRRHGHAHPTDEPLPTVTAAGNHHALIMRNNTARGDQAQMVTPVDEPIRTITTAGHQSLLVPYNGTGQARPTSEPLGTQPTKDRWALVDPDTAVDDCGFRMLEPHEIAAAMAFPTGYIPDTYTKRDRVKLAGNAVTPPVMTWITGRILQALISR